MRGAFDGDAGSASSLVLHSFSVAGNQTGMLLEAQHGGLVVEIARATHSVMQRWPPVSACSHPPPQPGDAQISVTVEVPHLTLMRCCEVPTNRFDLFHASTQVDRLKLAIKH